MIKTLTNDLSSDVQMLMQKNKKYTQKNNMNPQKFNNFTIMDSNESEVNEVSNNSKQ
jgi:hypothetical protein